MEHTLYKAARVLAFAFCFLPAAAFPAAKLSVLFVGPNLTAEHPYAALLWLDFLGSPEGQKIIDENEPHGGSVFTAGSTQEKATRGKKLSVVNWDQFMKMRDYQAQIVAAYGFPKAEK